MEIHIAKILIFSILKRVSVKISLQYSPTVFDGDNEGVLFCTDGDRDVISSLGEHNITQSSSAI